MNEKKDLTELVREAQAGSSDAMGELFLAWKDKCYYVAYKMLRDRGAAEDVVQETALLVCQNLRHLRQPEAFLGWVLRIGNNLCLRRLGRRSEVLFAPVGDEEVLPDIEDTDVSGIPHEVFDDAETRRMIAALVDALPEDQRLCVYMFYYEDLSVEDIAKTVGVGENTVKSRLYYARAKIRQGVEGYERQGIKLYTVPFWLLSRSLAGDAAAAPLSAPLTARLLEAARASVGGAAGPAGGAAGSVGGAAGSAGSAAGSVGGAAGSAGSAAGSVGGAAGSAGGTAGSVGGAAGSAGITASAGTAAAAGTAVPATAGGLALALKIAIGVAAAAAVTVGGVAAVHSLRTAAAAKQTTPLDTYTQSEQVDGSYTPEGASYALTYCVNKDGTLTVNGFTGQLGDSLDIPAEIEGKSVAAIGAHAFAAEKSVSLSGTLTLPETLRFIGAYAFNSSMKCAELTLPPALEGIGAFAFANSPALTSAAVPKTVSEIRNGAFSSCRALQVFTVEEGSAYFRADDGLLLSADGTSLVACGGGRAGSLAVPAGVTAICGYAVTGCSLLTEVSVPDSLTSIGAYAFRGCTGLAGTLTLPAGLAELGDCAFLRCPLTAVNVDSSNSSYTSLDGVVYTKDMTHLVLCPGGKSGTLTVPEGVKSIGFSAADSCTALTGLVLPTSLRTIGPSAFSLCTGLTRVELPDGLRSVDAIAFQHVAADIYVPDSLTDLGDDVFAPEVTFTHTEGSTITRVATATLHGSDKSAARAYALAAGLPYVDEKDTGALVEARYFCPLPETDEDFLYPGLFLCLHNDGSCSLAVNYYSGMYRVLGTYTADGSTVHLTGTNGATAVDCVFSVGADGALTLTAETPSLPIKPGAALRRTETYYPYYYKLDLDMNMDVGGPTSSVLCELTTDPQSARADMVTFPERND